MGDGPPSKCGDPSTVTPQFPSETLRPTHIFLLVITVYPPNISLVGAWATPLKNTVVVSWDDYSQWKVIKAMFQTTNQIQIIVPYLPTETSTWPAGGSPSYLHQGTESSPVKPRPPFKFPFTKWRKPGRRNARYGGFLTRGYPKSPWVEKSQNDRSHDRILRPTLPTLVLCLQLFWDDCREPHFCWPLQYFVAFHYVEMTWHDVPHVASCGTWLMTLCRVSAITQSLLSTLFYISYKNPRKDPKFNPINEP